MAKIVGIDLGTTNSVCAVMEGGEPTIIPSSEGGRLFPSVVAVNPKTDERMVGQVARRQAITNPENTIFSIKRLMGRKYQDAEGHPVRLTHEEMSFNAFNTDHRWLRLLHDYVTMYAHIHGKNLPVHLDAMQLIVEIDLVSDRAPADAILKKGMSVPQAIDKLIYALSSDLSSVRRAAMRALIHLEGMKNMKHRDDIHRKLANAAESSHSLPPFWYIACTA